jgi:hypothetical protein
LKADASNGKLAAGFEKTESGLYQFIQRGEGNKL